jgi:hypothetical protein
LPLLDRIMHAIDACLANETITLDDLVARSVAHPCATFEQWRLIWRKAGRTRLTDTVTPCSWMQR